MAKRLLTECPYCHRKVSYFGAGILKTKGEHCCTGCKCISNVVIHRALYGIGGGAVVLSLILVLVLSTYMKHDNIWGIIFVLLPYLVFYIVSPFFIKLEPCNDKSAVNKLRRKVEPVPEEKRQPLRRDEQPIELNVGEQFSSSFMKAKSSMKSGEENFSEEYSENIFPEEKGRDIDSGVDIDISADIKNNADFPGNEPDDDAVKIYGSEKTAGEDVNKQDSTNEVSTMPGNTKESNNEDAAAFQTEENNEVSFIFGRSYDDGND